METKKIFLFILSKISNLFVSIVIKKRESEIILNF